MFSVDSKAVPHPDVICTALNNGESVLLHLNTHTYFSLNETGSRIWSLMGDGLTLGEIGQTIEATYDVSADRAQSCVLELATALREQDLITTSPAVQLA